MKKLIAIALLSATAIPAYAAVGDGTFYVGADVGQAKASGNVTTGANDTSNTAYGLSVGYQFNRNWAAELGYTDFGTLDYGAAAGGGNSKTNAVSLSALGIWPLDNGFSLLGKLGVAGTSVDYSPALGGGSTNRRTGAVVGLGGQYNFTTAFGVRVAYDRFWVGSSSNNTDGSLNLLTAGVVYRF
ncbi:MAG: outer membrane beta-barrel protein [Pseudomonadota bacterium]